MGDSGGIHQAFGLRLRAFFPVPELAAAAGPGRVDVELSAAPAAVVDGEFSGPAAPRAARDGFLGGGWRYRTERGIAGDLRIEYVRGELTAAVHVAPGGGVVRCWAANADDPSWRRFLFDTVLGTVALARGLEALHAGAFERAGEAVAVVAGQGGGKSTLLAELVARGRPLLTDDVLTLARRGGRTVAHPGPPLMSLSPRLPDRRAPAQVGRVLAVVDGERWVAIDRASTRALPLGAVVFLTRVGHGATRVERLPASPAPLLAHSLPSGPEPARLDARFALFADIASSVPLLHLRVPVDLPAARIADAVEEALRGTRARGSAA